MPAPGDFVVGRYNSLGASIEEGNALIPDVKVKKLRESVAREAYRSGGEIIKEEKQVKGKKKKPLKITKKPTVSQAPASLPFIDFALEDVVNSINNGTELETGTHSENVWDTDTNYKTPAPEKKVKIVFSNDFGNIKVYAEDILYSDMSIALIFKNEEALTFIPKIGETLYIKIEDEDPIAVYFPGSIFTWTDKVKNVIILFKTNE